MRLTFLVLTSLAALTGCSRTPPCQDEVLAFTMASQMVEERTAPSGEVGSINDSEIMPITIAGECAFVVRAHVDGQNAFGGPVRQQFRATVMPDETGNNWQMQSFEFLP